MAVTASILVVLHLRPAAIHTADTPATDFMFLRPAGLLRFTLPLYCVPPTGRRHEGLKIPRDEEVDSGGCV